MGIDCTNEVVNEVITFQIDFPSEIDIQAFEDEFSSALQEVVVQCEGASPEFETLSIECEIVDASFYSEDRFSIPFESFGFLRRPPGFVGRLGFDCEENFDDGFDESNELSFLDFDDISECFNLFEDNEQEVDLELLLNDACDALNPPSQVGSTSEEDSPAGFIASILIICCCTFAVVALLGLLCRSNRANNVLKERVILLEKSSKDKTTLRLPQLPPTLIHDGRSVNTASISISSLNTTLTTDSYRSLVSAVDISTQKKIRAINREQSRRIVKMVKEGNTELDMTLTKLIHSIVDDLYYEERCESEIFADFSLEDVPEMRLEAFLERLGFGINQWYREEEENPDTAHLCFLFAIGYIKSLEKNKGLKLTEMNVHCLFAICILVAAKILEDDPISLEFWSDACGIDLDEILYLEKKLCFAIGFDVYFNADEYKALVLKYK